MTKTIKIITNLKKFRKIIKEIVLLNRKDHNKIKYLIITLILILEDNNKIKYI
jgi:hypothetical protein